MQLAMMHPADRDDELVAHSAPECARLCKGEIVLRPGFETPGWAYSGGQL